MSRCDKHASDAVLNNPAKQQNISLNFLETADNFHGEKQHDALRGKICMLTCGMHITNKLRGIYAL